MLDTILCVSDEEPVAFHPAGQRGFSVRLSYRVEDGDEAAAALQYQKFLKDLETVKFAAYEVTGSTLTRRADPQVLAEAYATDYGDEFGKWLDSRAQVHTGRQLKAGKAHGGFFVATPASTPVLKSEDTLGAEDIVLAAASWIAPVPQRLHLAFVLRVSDIGAGKPVVFLPCLAGAVPADPQIPPVVPVAGKMLRLADYAGAAGRSCETSVTKSLATTADKQSTTIDYGSGFADAGEGSEAGYRMLTRVEQRAGSLMSGLFAVRELSSAIRWPIATATAPLDPVLERQAVRLLAWSAVYAMASSLDTTLIALLMPGRERRDGALLAPFLDLLIDRLDALLGDKAEQALPALSRRKRVRESVRNAIGPVFAAAPASGIARRQLVETLATVCQIDTAIDAPLSAAETWRNKLLEFYIEPTAANYDVVRVAVLAMQAAGSGKDLVRAPAALLDQGLASLQDRVTSEAGTEATLERMLELQGVAAAFVTQLAAGNPEITAVAPAAWTEAVHAFKQRLGADINGADAARNAVGSLLADLLLQDEADRGKRGTVEQLRAAFGRGLFWHRRLGLRLGAGAPPPHAGLDAVVGALPRPVSDLENYVDQLDDARKTALNMVDVAALMQREASKDLFPPDTARFLPDHAPQPLPVRLTIDPAADDDDDDIDDFAAAFSGVAMLVRRSGAFAAGEKWAYANLAEVLFPDAPILPTANTGSIQPIPTTVVDGRRTLFVSYDGLPVATSAFDNTLNAPATTIWNKFTATDYPPLHPGFAPVAPLAYGARFDVAAHAVGRAGTLPLALQQDHGSLPWRALPAIAFTEEADGKRYVTRYPYSRRTAIGRTAITPVRAAGEAMPDGLRPLAADYPRLGLTSHHGQFLDVHRNNDGTGAIGLPQAAGATMGLTVRDLWLWAANGAGAKLAVGWMTAANAASHSAAEFSVDAAPGDLGDMVVTVTCTTAPTMGDFGTYTVTIEVGAKRLGPQQFAADASSAWLRLRLAAAGAAAIGLADPAADSPGTAAASRPVPDSLVLVGETGAALWKPQFSRPLQASVQYPRTGYLDFARWVANPILRKQVFGDLPRVDDFLQQLLGAYIGRTEDAELARLLERLPDPAVSEIRLELVATDALLADVGGVTTDPDLAPAQLALPLARLGRLLMQKVYDDWLAGARIKAILYRLDEELSVKLKVEAHPGRMKLTPGPEVVISVPPGVVARLSARPVVPRALFEPDVTGFPSVIDERLLQWAVGFDDDGKHVTFDGDSIQIEGMLGALSHKNDAGWRLSRQSWAEKTFQSMEHKPAAMAREYRLVAAPAAGDWHWRQLSAVDVSTQRWRFSGRPIYTWINPKVARDGTVAAPRQASIRLYPGHPDLAAFESEAFFGRMPYDAEVESALLLPLPARTELLDVPWEQASATMFRHRFTLRSRYAAAMLNSRDGACDAWPADAENAAKGWLRVAMLADRSHLTLTRPQLRALVPATCSADDGDASNPPLIGLLQERPFCNGGLAARIAAEIRTGIGFELNTVVKPLDARKELGPDPRLSYFGMPDAHARNVVLAPEGPIGLTFDSADNAAAAFSNTALLLAPRRLNCATAKDERALGSAHLAEHFMSVVLRRYLDHRWLVDEPVALQADQDGTTWAQFAQTWWIEFPACDGRLSVAGKSGERGMATACCSTEKIDGVDALVVTIDRFAIDATVDTRASAAVSPDPGHDATPLRLCCVPGLLQNQGGQAGSIVFLHTPVDPHRAILSVFFVAPRAQATQTGAGNSPTLLASVEWSVPEPFTSATIGIKGAGQAISMVNASATSALQWARTNTNFDTVCAVAPGAADAGEPVGVSDLTVTREKVGDGALLRFQRQSVGWWVRANQSTKPFPVHAQRHMAILPSQLRTGIGKAIDVPFPALMAPGREIVVPKIQNVDLVRIIEFETPAVIVGYQADGGTTVPEHYKTGYIDLHATGFDRMTPAAAPEGWQLSIHIRVIAGKQALASLTSLHLDMRSEANGKDWVSLPFNRTAGTASLAFVGNLPVAANGRANRFFGSSVNAAGTVEPAKPSQLIKPGDGTVLPEWKVVHTSDAPGAGSQGLDLRVSKATFQGGNAADLWLEISLLASVVRPGETTPSFMDGVDFDWFFGGAALHPDNAVTLGELGKMRESQARIISVSQPIKVGAA